MKKILLIILITLSLNMFGQQDDYMVLVNEMCSRIDVDSFKDLDQKALNDKLQKLGTEIREDYGATNDSILARLYRENQGYSQESIEGLFLLDFIELALDSCDAYGKVIVMAVGKAPEENEALKKILIDVNDFLDKKKGLTYSVLYFDIMTRIDKILTDNEDLINQYYPGGLDDENLTNDAIIYLSYHSLIFLKVIVLGQIEMTING